MKYNKTLQDIYLIIQKLYILQNVPLCSHLFYYCYKLIFNTLQY